jgi:hypothetical protein
VQPAHPAPMAPLPAPISRSSHVCSSTAGAECCLGCPVSLQPAASQPFEAVRHAAFCEQRDGVWTSQQKHVSPSQLADTTEPHLHCTRLVAMGCLTTPAE